MGGRVAAAALLLLAWLAPALAADRMDVYTLEAMSEDQRRIWIHEQLAGIEPAIVESAARNRVPTELVAACILNELADYNLQDQGQEVIFSTGSVGIAQISVLTAIQHGLVDISEAEIEARMASPSMPLVSDPAADELEAMQAQRQSQALAASLADDRQWAIRVLTWEKLVEPVTAVEAAARELSWLIDRVNENLQHTWPRALLTGPIDRADPHAALRIEATYHAGPRQPPLDPDDERIERERALTVLLCAAYNSPAILWSDFEVLNPFEKAGGCDSMAIKLRIERCRTPFYNARNHGVNAADLIAGLLGRWFEPWEAFQATEVTVAPDDAGRSEPPCKPADAWDFTPFDVACEEPADINSMVDTTPQPAGDGVCPVQLDHDLNMEEWSIAAGDPDCWSQGN